MAVRVQEDDFDLGAEIKEFGIGAGAVVTFTGIVRDNADQNLREMLIEHYPVMSQSALEQIEAEARNRWSLTDCLVIHRFGRLKPNQQIMMVATASTHRKAAFEAAEFLMDFLKSRAPFWKKEFTDQGDVWVDSKIGDEEAVDRWQ